MMKIKTNKITRRLLRTIGGIIIVWVTWSLHDYGTWTKFPTTNYPITHTVVDNRYNQQISLAKEHLKGTSKRLGVPSFSIAIGHNGHVIWSAAEGFSNMDSGITATPTTQYRVGSTSKAITATGVARLVDGQRLFLDHIIGDSITNWTKKRWEFTMRQLLSHTAGVGNYEDFGIASGRYTLCNCKQFYTASEGLKVFDRYKLLYKPGTQFKYSSFDINLASVVLEQAAASPFLDYIDDNVFNVLDMGNTYGDHSMPKSENLATFYQIEEGYYREHRTFGIKHDVNLSYKWAGGGFISTPTDLVKLGNAWVSDPTFLSIETKKEFWSPMRLVNGAINEQDYALGWRSWLNYENDSLLNGTPIWMVHHGGISKGSMNFLVLFPDYGLVVNASINGRLENFGTFAAEVRQFANFFLSDIPKKESELYQELVAAYKK